MRQRSGTGSRPNTRIPDGDEELHRELADEAEADHARGLAELRLGAPHPLHRDRADGRERGVLRTHTGADGHAEVRRHPVDLGVQRVLVPRARDELADGEITGAAPDFDHLARQRVTERREGVELVRRALVGLERPELRGGVDDLAHLVGPGARLARERELGLLDLHHLRAGRHE